MPLLQKKIDIHKYLQQINIKPSLKILITGGTSGIGRAFTLACIKKGLNPIVLARDPSRLGAPAQTIQADLGSLDSVANAIQHFNEPLDVVICCAAVIPYKAQVSQDGFELAFAVNHLSHFALLTWLREKHCLHANTRIVNISSGSHREAKTLDVAALSSPCTLKAYPMMQRYAETKLCNILFTQWIHQQWQLPCVAVHPGAKIRTQIARHHPFGKLWPLATIGSLTCNQAASHLAHAAFTEAIVPGAYYDGMQNVAPSKLAQQTELGTQLFHSSNSLLEQWQRQRLAS